MIEDLIGVLNRRIVLMDKKDQLTADIKKNIENVSKHLDAANSEEKKESDISAIATIVSEADKSAADKDKIKNHFDANFITRLLNSAEEELKAQKLFDALLEILSPTKTEDGSTTEAKSAAPVGNDEETQNQLKEFLTTIFGDLDKKSKDIISKENPQVGEIISSLEELVTNEDSNTEEIESALNQLTNEVTSNKEGIKPAISQAFRLDFEKNHELARQNEAAIKIQRAFRGRNETKKAKEELDELKAKKEETNLTKDGCIKRSIEEMEFLEFGRFELNRGTFKNLTSDSTEEITINKDQINKLFKPQPEGYGLEKHRLHNSSFRRITLDFKDVDADVLGEFLKNIDQANFFNCKIKNLDLTKVSPELLTGLKEAKFGGEKMEFEACNFGHSFKFKAENLNKGGEELPKGIDEKNNVSPNSSVRAKSSAKVSPTTRSRSFS